MSLALHAFMDGLVDYAGLFPPAALDMATAVKQYAEFRNQPESWMLGRFIVPADRLLDMAREASAHLSSGHWGVSALIGHRDNPEKSLAVLDSQCQAIDEVELAFGKRGRVEVLEVPLPSGLQPAELSSYLPRFLDSLDKGGIVGREIFVEIPPQISRDNELPMLEVLAVVAASRAGAGKSALRLGAKLRCGGVTPEAFPSVHKIARVVSYCRDLKLALKCTAGLHHPVRHQASEPVVMMHGFLNVFGAGLLAATYGWDAEKLSRVVAETEPESFAFDEEGFSWRGHCVSLASVRALRAQFLCGFGSCSFDEPRDDLQNLGLL